MNHDELSTLLREWDKVPEVNATTADCVMRRCAVGASESEPNVWSLFDTFWPSSAAGRVRFALVCLLMGLSGGAAFAEWVTLRHESLVGSQMTGEYLHSINPKFPVAKVASTRP